MSECTDYFGEVFDSILNSTRTCNYSINYSIFDDLDKVFDDLAEVFDDLDYNFDDLN